jgi:glycosyltransferase involved in cell wall biosynthesis
MATGLYTMFWERFHTSCEKYLCTDASKKYFVFTDDKSLLSLKIPNVTFIPYEDKGWLVNVSSKCKCILSIREEILKQDYAFYFNANYEVLAPVYTHDILPDESDNCLSALCFYKGTNNNLLPYDRNRDSLAYIPFGEGKHYFLSSFFGGRSPEFLKLCEWSNESVFADLKKGIVAKTHDESYLNRYLIDIPPKIIDMVFGTPEGWAPVEQCKGIFYNKDKLFGKEKIHQLREPFELHLPYLYGEKYEIAPLSIVETGGGLGTQMFQYAFMLGQKYLSAQGRYYLYATEDSCNLANVFANLDKEDFISGELWQNIVNTPAYCIKRITDLNDNYPVKNEWKLVTRYSGHWQSGKYFNGITPEIKKRFQFDETRLNSRSKEMLDKMDGNSAVAVHIRRRDSANCNDRLLYDGICTQEYYLAAIKEIIKETDAPLQIYLFGNDKKWLNENIFIPDSIIVDWNREQDDWQDMYLMSRCKYHIISNSSFSWWAAWLCEVKDRKTFSPGVWSNNKNITDAIPEEWIKIPVKQTVTLPESKGDKLKSSDMIPVTVLIPVYNAEPFLHETIDSVLSQTFPDFELLLLDDGSTDRSAEIIKSYGDPRIRYVLCPHDFIGTLNYGLSVARGKYIALLDHDDIMMEYRLQTQYEYMESHPDITACGGYLKTFGKYSMEWKSPLEYHHIILEYFRKTMGPVYNPTGFIRREDIEKHNIRYKRGYSFAADTKFWTDVIKTGKIVNIPEILTLYRIHDTQTSAIALAESGKAAETINHELIQFLFSKLDDNEEIKSVLQKQFIPVMDKLTDLSFFSSNIYFTFMSEIIEGLYNNGFLNLDEPLVKDSISIINL